MSLECNHPSLRSWVDIRPDSDFPIQNLPFGTFRTRNGETRAGVAIGDEIVDLLALANGGFLKDALCPPHLFAAGNLNEFIALGRPTWRVVRERVSKLLRSDNPELRDNAAARKQILRAQSDVEMLLPVSVPNYVDFYSSKEHATNVGKMFRDETNPLLPNWKHIPIGYNGRASSVMVSGKNFHRPLGQLKADTEEAPQYAPSRQMDFELETGFIVGKETRLGTRIRPQEADEYIFGLVLLNDWSARDIQKWEYVPLGPFLGKSFATSISPWIVTLDALQPFRVENPAQDVPVLPHLRNPEPASYDIQLDVLIQASTMKEPQLICRSNFRNLYWTINQQLAHLTSNGTNLCVGDLCGSGTISGTAPDSLGSMLEICWKGTRPLTLADGSKRVFLQDGDTIILRGHGTKDGIRVGLGEVRSTILPALG